MKKSTILWGLVALNAFLLVVLINLVTRDNLAVAQNAPAARGSDFVLIPGEVQGISGGMVFVLDSSRGMVSGMSYNQPNNQFTVLAPVDLTRVFGASEQPNPRDNRGPSRVRPQTGQQSGQQ